MSWFSNGGKCLFLLVRKPQEYLKIITLVLEREKFPFRKSYDYPKVNTFHGISATMVCSYKITEKICSLAIQFSIGSMDNSWAIFKYNYS